MYGRCTSYVTRELYVKITVLYLDMPVRTAKIPKLHIKADTRATGILICCKILY